METFQVHILGCGSALPTLKHFPTCQVVDVRGKLMMIDCGEGAQLQLRRCKIHFSRITSVFISHLHGDHCFGLIGMISTFGMTGRTAPLHIYGHKDLGEILDQAIRFFCSSLEYEVVFHAIDPSRHEVIYEDRSLTVETIPLQHRVPCCGFLFREKAGLPHIRRDMIDFCEIPISQIGNIKAGADWQMSDGTVIPNHRLVTPADPPRSYAYCSDTRYEESLADMVKDVSLLYHESTYAEDMIKHAKLYHHSTARQAATIAQKAHVGQLVLGHYSARYDDEQILLDEARQVFPHTILSHEGDVISVTNDHTKL